MAEDGPTNRLTLLLSAFHSLVPSFPTLVANRAIGGGMSQLALRLTGNGTEVVDLDVRIEGAALSGTTGADESHAGTARIEDVLSVDLREGYTWDSVTCDSAEELATLLAKHMRRRLKALGDIQPSH